MAILLPAWSLLLSYLYSGAGEPLLTCTILLGITTALRFFFLRSREQDGTSYLSYNVSMVNSQFSLLLDAL